MKLEDVGRSFLAGDVEIPALVGATIRIDTGEYVAIVGPSGSGKSTLLNVLGLLDRPTAGTYWFEGIDTSTLSEGQRAGLRSRRIGFVFQSFHLLAHRTVLENVMLATMYNGMPRGERQPAALAALEQVGLSHRIDFRPTRLSGGERQRVAIARALVTRPAVLLADEPTGNLDSVNGLALLTLFEQLREEGLTLIVVTHDSYVAEHADRIISLRDGRVEAA